MPSIAKHHAEWLSLVETSGPFLSMPVLMRVFPQGLEPHEPDRSRALRLAHEEWEEKQHQAPVHNAWIRHVLHDVLEYDESVLMTGQDIPQSLQISIPGHGDVIRPDVVLQNPSVKPDSLEIRMLVQAVPPEQNLDRPLKRLGAGSAPS